MRKAAEFESPEVQKPARNRDAIRKTRVPIGGDVLRLAVLNWPHPDYRPFWFNDKDARIQLAIQAGYDFVTVDELGDAASDGADNRVRRVVGKGDDGRPLYAYLMKIHKEFVEEDEAAREAKRAAVEAQTRAGTLRPTEAGNFYSPNRTNVLQTKLE